MSEHFRFEKFQPRPLDSGNTAMMWLAYVIGVVVILAAIGTAVAAVWTGEWRYLIVTVFIVWLCNKSTER